MSSPKTSSSCIEAVCVHEAAHALVCVLCRLGHIERVTVEPNGRVLGHVVIRFRKERGEGVVDFRNQRDIDRRCMLCLAGFAAEIIRDTTAIPTGCDDEVFRAWQLVHLAGGDRDTFEELVFRTVHLLQSTWHAVQTLACGLERYRTLGGRSVRALLQRELGLHRPRVAKGLVTHHHAHEK